MPALAGRTVRSRLSAAVVAVLCLGAALAVPKPAEARIWVGFNFGVPVGGYYAPYYPAYYPAYGYGYYPHYYRWRHHYHRAHYARWRHHHWCNWHPYRCRYY
jgi:hypothetical protein